MFWVGLIESWGIHTPIPVNLGPQADWAWIKPIHHRLWPLGIASLCQQCALSLAYQKCSVDILDYEPQWIHWTGLLQFHLRLGEYFRCMYLVVVPSWIFPYKVILYRSLRGKRVWIATEILWRWLLSRNKAVISDRFVNCSLPLYVI